jgi:hypothetical protein
MDLSLFGLNYDLSELDPDPLDPEIISLEPAMLEQASILSAQIPNECHRWQVYINALGLYAFEEWFLENNQVLELDKSECSLLNPSYANLLPIVCNLNVNQFRLSLIVVESPLDEIISVPRFTVENPIFSSHFYVLLEVQEEQEQAILRGYLRYDQMINQSILIDSGRQSYHSYPWQSFDNRPYHLFYCAQFLQSSDYYLPKHQKKWQEVFAQSSHLIDALPWQDIISKQVSIVDLLTYEQLELFLYCPPFVQLLYLVQSQRFSVEVITQHIQTIVSIFTQPVVNFTQWLQGHVEQLNENISNLWTDPQPLTYGAMRRTTNAFEQAINFIQSKEKFQIPESAQFTQTVIANSDLDLYIVTWLLPSQEEWSMLAVLVAKPGAVLLEETSLHAWLKDDARFWVDTVSSDVNGLFDHLYLILEGRLDEAFILSVQSPHQLPTILPAFAWTEFL